MNIDNNMINSPGFLALVKSPFLSPYAYNDDGQLTNYLSQEDDYLKEVLGSRASLSNPLSILENGDGINKNYFGSRLMTTVREEKGYTYGIFSTHTVYRNQSYIDIETQTAIEYVKPLIEAVFQEMEKLKQEPAGAEEMQLLRNYLSGEYARMMDGPFALADLYIAAESVGMDMASYRQQLEVMNRISGEELQALAQKYFHEEDFYLVCAGGTQSPF